MERFVKDDIGGREGLVGFEVVALEVFLLLSGTPDEDDDDDGDALPFFVVLFLTLDESSLLSLEVLVLSVSEGLIGAR